MNALTIYIIIGLIYGAIVNYAGEEVAKKTNDEDARFGTMETLVLILLWPIYVATFIYYIFKNDEE